MHAMTACMHKHVATILSLNLYLLDSLQKHNSISSATHLLAICVCYHSGRFLQPEEQSASDSVIEL